MQILRPSQTVTLYVIAMINSHNACDSILLDHHVIDANVFHSLFAYLYHTFMYPHTQALPASAWA